MDQNNTNVNNGMQNSSGQTTNSIDSQMPQSVNSINTNIQETVQTVAVGDGTLDKTIKFNIPAEQTASNVSQVEPVPVIPNENVQPTLGSFINNMPVQDNNVNTNVMPNPQYQNTDNVVPDNQNVVQNNTSETVQSNSIGTIQNAPMPQQNDVGSAQVLPGEAEPKKKSNLLLKVIIFVLLAAIGAVVGVIAYEKFANRSNENEDINGGEQTLPALNQNVINTSDVELATLTKVLNIVGIASTQLVSNNNLLNYYISNEKYQDNAKEIISYYASANDLFQVLPEDVCEGVHCVVINKEEVLRIFKLYNFGGNITDYFVTDGSTEDNLLKKDYSFEDKYLFPDRKDLDIPNFAKGEEFDIKHTIDSQYDNNKQIQVVDNQIMTYYDDAGSVKTDNKKVTYQFRQDDTEEYYLYSVTTDKVD